MLFLGRKRQQIRQDDTVKRFRQLGGIASAVRTQPPLPGVSPDDDPLILSAVETESVGLAEYPPGPRLVEVAQQDPHVLLLELLERRPHLRSETQRLHELHLALVQIGHQPIVHLENSMRKKKARLESVTRFVIDRNCKRLSRVPQRASEFARLPVETSYQRRRISIYNVNETVVCIYIRGESLARYGESVN